MSAADPWWSTLVSALESVGQVAAREPAGLAVTMATEDGGSRTIEIVLTPREWDFLVSISWGFVDLAAEHVCGLLREQPVDQRYLVYGDYQVVARDTPERRVDRDLQRLAEIAAQYQDGVIPGAGWYAFPSGEAPADRAAD